MGPGDVRPTVMRDPRTHAARRRAHRTELTWDGVLASLALMLVVPVAMLAISYPVLAAAAATGAVLPGLARRTME